MKRFIFLLFGLILLTGCGDYGTSPQTTEQEEAFPVVEVVQLRVGNVTGNGVLWEKTEEKLIVVTAGHLFEMGSGEAEVTFADGLTVAVAAYEKFKPDLAFVFIDSKQIPEEQSVQYHTVTGESRTPELQEVKQLQSEDTVVLKTFGTDSKLQVLEGTVLYPWIYIEDFEAHMILAKLDAEQGMSGSGLFDCDGYFLGILCGESEDGEAAVISRSVLEAAYVMISENF